MADLRTTAEERARLRRTYTPASCYGLSGWDTQKLLDDVDTLLAENAKLDPRPYAAPTDLVTAADVARWLLEHAEQWRRDAAADPSLGAHVCRLDFGGLRALQGAHADLRARLDRERRQACRRGALDRWRRVRELVRWAGAYRDATWAWHEIAPSLWFALRDALAFRAAARQP